MCGSKCTKSCCSASKVDPTQSLEINGLPNRSASNLRADQQTTITVQFRYGETRLSNDFTIKPRWNDVEMRSDLLIYGERVSMHRASQKIIGDVLVS